MTRIRSLQLVLALVLVAGVMAAGGVDARADALPPLPSPARWPLGGTPTVVRGFDPPDSRWGAGHRGVDLAGRVGEPVLAAAPGTVTYARMLAGRGVVVVDHGSVRTTYEPVTAGVGAGTPVRAGTPIGVLAAGHGDGGSALHWGLRAGQEYLDPLLLVPTTGSGRYRLLPAGSVDGVRSGSAARTLGTGAGVTGAGVTGAGPARM